MAAAFMLLQVHGWDIHAVTTGQRARKASHGSTPGHTSTTGDLQARRRPLTINLSGAALRGSDLNAHLCRMTWYGWCGSDGSLL
jgi:hypothetical protein